MQHLDCLPLDCRDEKQNNVHRDDFPETNLQSHDLSLQLDFDERISNTPPKKQPLVNCITELCQIFIGVVV